MQSEEMRARVRVRVRVRRMGVRVRVRLMLLRLRLWLRRPIHTSLLRCPPHRYLLAYAHLTAQVRFTHQADLIRAAPATFLLARHCPDSGLGSGLGCGCGCG